MTTDISQARKTTTSTLSSGWTLLKTFDHNSFEMADTSVLEQGVARYVWDGEEAIGLFERCTLRERLTNLDAALAGAQL